MFAILLLVFKISTFNSHGTLLSNVCTTSMGIMPLGRGNLWFISYIWFALKFGGVLIDTTVLECGLNFTLPLFLINSLYCRCGNTLHNHLPINRQKMSTCYAKSCSYMI